MPRRIGMRGLDSVAEPAAEAVGGLIPWPVVDTIVGQGLYESIKWVAEQAKLIWDYPENYQKLLEMMKDPRLLERARMLDLLTDQPGYQRHRPAYNDLCALLEDAAFELASAPVQPLHDDDADDDADEGDGGGALAEEADAAEPASVGVLGPGTWSMFNGEQGVHRIVHRRKPGEVAEALNKFCDLHDDLALQQALDALPQPKPIAITPQPPERQQSLHRRLGPALRPEPDVRSALRARWSAPPEKIFQHLTDLVPNLTGTPSLVHSAGNRRHSASGMLQQTRNIGLVGMGGIGKTTVARAVYERANCKSELGLGEEQAEWLPVSSEVNETKLLSLLERAFLKLYAGFEFTFTFAQSALEDLTWRLRNDNRPVLLVLDDVWTNPWHAVVAALNFATHPGCCLEGSRLIVATPEAPRVSYHPASKVAPDTKRFHVKKYAWAQ